MERGVSGQVQDVTRTADVTQGAPQGNDQMPTEQRAEPRVLLERGLSWACPHTRSCYSFPFSRTTLTLGEGLRALHGTGAREAKAVQGEHTWDLLWERLRRNFWKLQLFLQGH